MHDGEWDGQRCFIVGGGPSLRGFDFDTLRGNRVIAINRAYIDVPWADVFFTEDLRFVEEFSKRDDWDSFQGVRVVHCLDDAYRERFLRCDPRIRLIRRIPKSEAPRCWGRRLEDGLSYASNSGIGAVNLACILGADPVYLLGFDCRRFDGMSNFHEDYAESWRTGDDQYRNFLNDMVYWVKPHVRGRRVFNVVNPEMPSAIPDAVFPHVRVEDVTGEGPGRKLP